MEIAPVVEAFNRLLSQVRDASTMQQRFLANAAHQLRTPLAGLQMHLELLLRRESSPDVRGEVERMHGATVRASRLANQLLALAKAESAPDHGRELERVDLRTIAGAAAREWAPKAHALDIDLGFALDRAEMRGDPLLLPELVDNLLDNALRYTPPGGAVTVRTGCHDGVAVPLRRGHGSRHSRVRARQSAGALLSDTRNARRRFGARARDRAGGRRPAPRCPRHRRAGRTSPARAFCVRFPRGRSSAPAA